MSSALIIVYQVYRYVLIIQLHYNYKFLSFNTDLYIVNVAYEPLLVCVDILTMCFIS